MNDCIFCKIIKGEMSSYTIYEDDLVKVFLDINPSTNGDLLIIPKEHVVTINDVSEELMVHILKIEKELWKLLKEKLNCEGLTISQNNDYGQEVKHFHIHLTPRYENDMLGYSYNKDVLKELSEISDILTH